MKHTSSVQRLELIHWISHTLGAELTIDHSSTLRFDELYAPQLPNLCDWNGKRTLLQHLLNSFFFDFNDTKYTPLIYRSTQQSGENPTSVLPIPIFIQISANY